MTSPEVPPPSIKKFDNVYNYANNIRIVFTVE